MSALTNSAASFQDRARSYLDANCAQCHLPGGTGPTFDARYDTPLPLQNLTNFTALFSLGNDHEQIVHPDDIWRSSIYARMNIVDQGSGAGSIQMPPLARRLIDTNALAVLSAWINSLPGTPALAPPVITPAGGIFSHPVSVTLQSTNQNAALYYTLDGSLPATNSFLYTGPFTLTNSATVAASAIWPGLSNSIAPSALYVINPPFLFTSASVVAGGAFQLGFLGLAGNTYVLQATTNFVNWTPIATNPATTNAFYFSDPGATNFPLRFYRVMQQ
jgi:hypothetical protein